jgi:hypothetical protein
VKKAVKRNLYSRLEEASLFPKDFFYGQET